MLASHALLSFSLLYAGAAAACDLRRGEIPNRLTLGGFAIGAALQLALPWLLPPSGVASSAELVALALGRVLGGALACGLTPYLLFTRGAMGGGDVKLLGGLGACLGPIVGLEVELYAFVAMLLYAPALLAYRGQLLEVVGRSTALLVSPLLPHGMRREASPAASISLKFGPAVFVAVAAVALLRWRSV